MSSSNSYSDEELKVSPKPEKTPKNLTKLLFDEKALESQEDEYYMSEPSLTPRSKSQKDLLTREDSIPIGAQDKRFTQAFGDLMNNFKVPHYGCDHSKDTFQVCNPSLVNNKYVVYTVKGEDNLGYFEGQRRYNEFFQIRSILVHRWPGIFVPALPPKKAVGNKDLKFLLERRYFLERFFKQVSSFNYLINQEEFRIFARPEFQGGNSDVEKQLIKLPKLSISEITQRFQEAFQVEEVKYKILSERKEEWEKKISDFEQFLRKLMVQYKGLRKQLKELIDVKNIQIDTQKEIVNILNKFEDRSLGFYCEGNSSKLILADQTNDLMKNFQEMVIIFEFKIQNEKIKNPFFNLYYWVKGEIIDVHSLLEAINVKNSQEQQLIKNIQKRNSLQLELEKLIGGKTMLKTLFKTINEKQNYSMNLQKQLENLDEIIENQQKLGVIVNWQLGDVFLNEFKKEKIENFSKILREMASIEVDNSNYGASYWSKVLGNSNLKHF